MSTPTDAAAAPLPTPGAETAVKASAADVAAPTGTEAAAKAPEAAAAPPPPAQRAAADEPNRELEMPPNPTHEWMQKAIENKRAENEAKEALAASVAELEKARTEAKEKEEMRAELEALRAERAAAAEAKKREEEKQFMIIAKSFFSNGKEAGYTDDAMQKAYDAQRMLFEANPEAAISSLDAASEMALCAANSRKEANEATKKSFARRRDYEDTDFYARKASEYEDLERATTSFSRSARPAAAGGELAVKASKATGPASAAAGGILDGASLSRQLADEAAAAAASDATTEVAEPAASHKRPFADYNADEDAYAEGDVFVVKASKKTFPAADVAAQIAAVGRVPTYLEVAHGFVPKVETIVKAGVNGQRTTTYETEVLRETPARIAPDNFAPAFSAKLQSYYDKAIAAPVATDTRRAVCVGKGNPEVPLAAFNPKQFPHICGQQSNYFPQFFSN